MESPNRPQKKQPPKIAMVFGYIVVFGIIALVIWGAVSVVSGGHRPTSDSKPAKSVSTSTATPAIDTKLNALLSALKQNYPSVNDSYLINKDRDPDQGFGQPNSYNAGIAFCDSPNTLKAPADSVVAGSSSKAYGFACGGVVEVYPDSSGVAKRVAYYDNLRTNPELSQCKTVNAKDVCDYKAIGDVFLHISDQYPVEQWTPILEFFTAQVRAVNL